MSTHRHFIFHKPYGTISQFVNPNKRKKKTAWGALQFSKKNNGYR